MGMLRQGADVTGFRGFVINRGAHVERGDKRWEPPISPLYLFSAVN